MSSSSHLESLFFAALSRKTVAERAAYLDEACEGDADLRSKLIRMLEAQAAGFLDAPPDELAATIHHLVPEQIGSVIGPFKLLQQIGEGGMGVVFMAEQMVPVERKVALKIIKPGMDTRRVIARFEAERQALALMDHPNIARVLDAGATESGRPYFVMELVRGVPITEYCDVHQLSPRERIELFLPVCHAVQHAHQKGIIHRDLKPSNILIAEYDHEPVAKVIDFGVAKATAQRLTERTLFTEFGQVMGTVEYMSPEQAKLNQLDVDTRSDIYSLGVLLYELLTGDTPYDRQRLRSAAFDEVLRIIREDEPPRPSTRLSSSIALPKVASNRRLDPAKLAKLIRGELDWIVMKCLEKDRNRRYETANGLAADLQNYLQDEPVQACPPSAYYRLKKFVRRNNVLAAYMAGLTFAMIISVVFIVSLVQQREAKEAALEIATTNEARATAISGVMQEMLQAANPDAAHGANYTVRRMLDDFSAKFSDQLDDQPEVKATIHSIIGNAYQRLGELEEALPHLESALKLRRKLFGQNHIEVANSLINYARFRSELGHTQEAIALAQEALEIHDDLNTPEEQRMKVLDELALHLWAVGEWSRLESVIEEIRVIAAKNPDKYPERANLLHRLAETMVDPVVGEEYAREAVALHRRLHGNTHPETAWGMQALAKTLRRQGKFAEAEQYYKEALAVFRTSYDNSSAPVVLTLANIATVRRFREDEAGLQVLRDEAETLANLQSTDYERWMYAGHLHAQLGQWEHAEASFERMGEMAPKRSHYSLGRIAWVRLARKDIQGFSQTCTELVGLAQSCDDPECWEYAAWTSSIIPDSGVPSLECQALATRALQTEPMNVVYLTTSGAVLYRAGKLEEARHQLSSAIIQAKHTFTYAHFYLAMAEHRLGRTVEGRECLDLAIKYMKNRKLYGESHVITEWHESIAMQLLKQEAEKVLAGT